MSQTSSVFYPYQGSFSVTRAILRNPTSPVPEGHGFRRLFIIRYLCTHTIACTHTNPQRGTKQNNSRFI